MVSSMRRDVTPEKLRVFMRELAAVARSPGKVYFTGGAIRKMINYLDRSLPGAELVQEGLADLAAGRRTELSLLALVAAPRLRALGLTVPQITLPASPEHLLYERIEERLGRGAHSFYNSLIRRIVSYARALERERGRLGLNSLS